MARAEKLISPAKAAPPREAHMLFMVIEKFKNRNARAVYRRADEKGRMLPNGLKYIDSWVETNFDRCFQLMECDDATLFQQWTIQWQDLVDFEIIPVIPSREAAKAIITEEK